MTMSELARGGDLGVAGGPFGSSLGRKDYVPDGVPVIRGTQLSGLGRFSLSDLVFVSSEKADAHRRNLAYPGDLVVTQRGTVGQVGLIPKGSPYARFLISQSQMKLTVEPTMADAEFLYFALSSPETRQRLIDHAITTGVPHINLSTLRAFKLSVPGLPEQRRIAVVLSIFDELIAINSRRIELLEDLARSLYREWFVRFRFPGHEDVRFLDSELGPIPASWQVSPLARVADARRGLSWSRNDECDDGDTAVVTIPNVTDRLRLDGCTRLANVSESVREKYSLLADDVVMIGSNGNPRRVGQAVRVEADTDALFASFLMRVRAEPRSIVPALLYHQLSDPRVIDQMRDGAVGSTGLRNIRITSLRSVRLLVPSSEIQSRFADCLDPIAARCRDLSAEVAAAATTRDVLLPRLVTGQLEISDVDLSSLLCTAA